MNTIVNYKRKLNGRITRRIIELQEKGYHYDYLAMNPGTLYCVQDNQFIPSEDTTIKLIDHGYDYIDRCFKYVHIVELTTGQKGMLIMPGIFMLGITKL